MCEGWRAKLQLQYQCLVCGAKKEQLKAIGRLLPTLSKDDLIQWCLNGHQFPAQKNFRPGIIPGWIGLDDYPAFLDHPCFLHSMPTGWGPVNFNCKSKYWYCSNCLPNKTTGATNATTKLLGSKEKGEKEINSAFRELTEGLSRLESPTWVNVCF